MKKHSIWIALVAVGVLLIVGNLVYPFIAMAIAAHSEPLDEPIAIIGAADEPTTMFVYSLILNRTNIALIALGILSLLAGIVVAVAGAARSRDEKRAKTEEVSE